MRTLIKKLVKSLGFDIVRYQNNVVAPIAEPTKTVKTDKLTLYNTATGNYYLPTDAHKDVIANAIKNNEVFEEEVINCAKQYVVPGSAVLDVGTNFGQMSILFSGMVGDSGIVYSFEADDFVFEIIKKNIDANNRKNIVPTFGAVHDINDSFLYFPEQDFERFGSYGSYGIDYLTNKGRKVKTLTIDSLNIEKKVSFMKIDIQGGDLFALKGAKETIKRNQMPILFEFEYQLQDDLKLDFQDYVDFVQEIGYKFQRVIYGHNYLIVPR